MDCMCQEGTASSASVEPDFQTVFNQTPFSTCPLKALVRAVPSASQPLSTFQKLESEIVLTACSGFGQH